MKIIKCIKDSLNVEKDNISIVYANILADIHIYYFLADSLVYTLYVNIWIYIYIYTVVCTLYNEQIV